MGILPSETLQISPKNLIKTSKIWWWCKNHNYEGNFDMIYMDNLPDNNYKRKKNKYNIRDKIKERKN